MTNLEYFPTVFVILTYGGALATVTINSNWWNAKCWRSIPTDVLTAEALIQTLNGKLLASPSATITLTEWCDEHKLAPVAKITSTPIPISSVPPLPEIAVSRLGLSGNYTTKYRKVQLKCGDKVLSEADNWYVPSRLNDTMNEQLDHSNTPFGRVVLPFKPFRRTYSVDFLWKPLPDSWETTCEIDRNQMKPVAQDEILQHTATVLTEDGLPISYVIERYKIAMLTF